jgi:DNA polymerase-4
MHVIHREWHKNVKSATNIIMSKQVGSVMADRAIIHIDMDAFYASVEQRDFPEYRGKALIVGGDPDVRGVVATCSYEARQFGVHSAMPCAMARRKCPHAIFVRPRFDVYREVSQQIRAIFHRYTDLVEPLSLDEAYLDVSEQHKSYGSGVLIAKDIRRLILHDTGLTASAGVSYNKFLAKIASDRCKPNGLLYISPAEGPNFVRKLPIREFHGIGPATEEKMQRIGIYRGNDLLAWNLAELESLFGKSARYYFDAARGQDKRPVEAHRPRKSVSTEDTFGQDIVAPEEMLQILYKQAKSVCDDLTRLQVVGRTLTIKVKFSDFSTITRSMSRDHQFGQIEDYLQTLPALLESALVKPLAVRLLGVSVSNLTSIDKATNSEQIPLL